MSLVQHMMPIADNRVENLLSAEHLCLEQLQMYRHIININTVHTQQQPFVHIVHSH